MIAKFVNELRDTANKYAGCECMRDVMSRVVHKYVESDDRPNRLPITEQNYEMPPVKEPVVDEHKELMDHCTEQVIKGLGIPDEVWLNLKDENYVRRHKS